MDGLVGDDGVQDLELGVSDRLLAQRTFAGSPLEALHDRVLDRAQQPFVDLRRQGVVDKNVGAFKNEIIVLNEFALRSIRGGGGSSGSAFDYGSGGPEFEARKDIDFFFFNKVFE